MSIIAVYLPKAMISMSGEDTMEALNEIELMWHERIELAGQKKFLLHQLEKKFGRLPTELIAQLEGIEDDSILQSLGEQVLTATKPEDIVIPA
jgi:hypothetical protein